MSRIYFHSEHDGAAELRGSERAYMGALCGRLLVATLEPIESILGREDENPIRRLVPPEHYMLRSTGPQFADQFRLWATFSLSYTEGFVYQDRHVTQFDAALNTALMLGNDAVKLAARLHGQCEIHCYVEGPNRAWLAGIMDAGRAMHLYRDDQGWEAVIALLRKRDDAPVVCSYSVCEGFPNARLPHAAGLWDAQPYTEDDDELNWEPWYDLPAAERWRLALAALRTKGSGLELKPDRWAWPEYYLADGITGLDLRRWIDAERELERVH